MLVIRRIGLVVLAVAAVAAFFLMAPEVSSDTVAGSYDLLIDLAESSNETNSARTESAPQQQVVNGWYANNLLNIIARENARTATQSTDDRTAALLVIGVLAIALWGATSIPTPAPESLPIPIPAPGTTTEPDEPIVE
jgi:hypothetical protein